MLSVPQKIMSSWTDNIYRFGGELFRLDNLLIGVLVLFVAVLIQILFPPGTRTLSRKAWIENFDRILKFDLWAIIGSSIPTKYLKEYRCPTCYKLLAKGRLSHTDDILEVKCRGCSTICLFKGEDANIIEKRSELLKKGLIPDTE